MRTVASSLLLLLLLLLATRCCVVSAQDGFRQLFSSQLEYGLAVAGISLGCAMLAAVAVALVVFCVLRQRRRKLKQKQKSEFGAGGSSSGGVGGDDVDGRLAADSRRRAAENKQMSTIALPSVAPANGAASPVASKTSTQSFSDGRRLTDSGNSVGLRSGAEASLFRQSSLLRPMPLGAAVRQPGDRASAAAAADRPVIQHALIRTSPMQTLQARTFLSQYSIAQPEPTANLKRSSYAEQKARISSFEINDQVFTAASLPRQQQRVPSQPPLPEQPARKQLPAPPPPPQQQQQRRKQQQQQQQQQRQPSVTRVADEPAPRRRREAADAEDGPSFPRPVSSPSQQAAASHSLRRIPLGGGGAGGDDDGRSSASTVMRQEALQAFEFLEDYE